jgi:hypothetical protein
MNDQDFQHLLSSKFELTGERSVSARSVGCEKAGVGGSTPFLADAFSTIWEKLLNLPQKQRSPYRGWNDAFGEGRLNRYLIECNFFDSLR